jgi:hypothetical protein
MNRHHSLAHAAANSGNVDTSGEYDMANIYDELRAAQGGHALDNLSRQFGLTPQQAENVVRSVLPQISAQLERNTLSRGGLADLVNALGQGHHEAYLDNPSALSNPEVRTDGDAVLGHILGSKDKSRAVADRAALSSGVSSSIIKMMLPYIASMLMGALSKQFKGGIGDILGRMGGVSVPAGRGGDGSMRMPELPRMPEGGDMGGGPFGGGTMESEPSRVPGRGGLQLPPETTNRVPGMGSGSPLPLPGDKVPGIPGNADNPFGDLSDIIRRGGRMPSGSAPSPDAAGGGVLWSIVRGILGSALGFQSRGVLGWLFRVIFVKFGWTILRRVLFGR